MFVASPKGEMTPAAVMNLFAKNCYLRVRGLQPHTRRGTEDGVDGLFVWAEKNGA